MNTAVGQTGVELCRASIAHHSKSFALASRLLPGQTADRAAIVYAWCRRADDAIDSSPALDQPAALARLRDELDAVYRGDDLATDPALAQFQLVVRRCGIPREYPWELLAGMEMDCLGQRYADWSDLLSYCFRVAGTVGLMMCHVMGLRNAGALRNAAHLGIAMQLTNICRDVMEDWEMGRLYLPRELLAECGVPGLAGELGQPFPSSAVAPVARAVRSVLATADEYYRSGDAGLRALSWRCALAVRAARSIYAAIGRRVERQDCDVTEPRAFTSKAEKLWHVARAAVAALAETPRRAVRRFHPAILDPDRGGKLVRFPQDVVPV